MNAAIRMAHPNPTRGIRWLIVMGKIMPPVLEPLKVIPKARPRLWRNQVATALRAWIMGFNVSFHIFRRKWGNVLVFKRSLRNPGSLQGVKSAEAPIALTTPCARMNW